MTTDPPTTGHTPIPPGPETTAPRRAKLDLSVTQVVGGALAAMTAAFLGSRLSLAGTVTGAAVASIVAAVATNLYTASLRNTREKVRTVLRGRTGSSLMPVLRDSRPGAAALSALPGASAPAPHGATQQRVGRHRLQWQSVLLGALTVFALTAALLTGLELTSGRALSGGRGTTVSQVTEHQPASAPTTEPVGGSSASPRAKASDTPTPTAPTPSAPTSNAPTPTAPTPTVGAEPSGGPSVPRTAPTPPPRASATSSGTRSADSPATSGAGSSADPSPGQGAG